MWQGHLIRPAPFVAPAHSPRWRRVYTPTPDGFERFLSACVGLSPAAVERTREFSF